MARSARTHRRPAEGPLTLTLQDAQAIDKLVKKAHVNSLKLAYDAAVAGDTTRQRFEDLPAEAQTVISSVSFQYGTLSVAAPKFWKAAVSQDWKEVSKIFKAFGDVYKTRRNKEAAVIDKLIP